MERKDNIKNDGWTGSKRERKKGKKGLSAKGEEEGNKKIRR